MITESDKRLTLGSLFDGIGGFPLCAVLSGVTPIWAAEVDPACVAVTKQRFPNMKHLGDVSKINGSEITPVDIITFGSPCQDLSVAGERKGLKHVDNGSDETTRSGLFIDAIRIVYEMREATYGRYPTYIVWENVEGAFNSRGGRDFQTVLEKITKTEIPVPQSGKWAKAGVVRGGEFAQPGDSLTLNIGESPSVESVSTLSAVLETIVPPKYFLSATACNGILRRARNRHKPLPPLLEKALQEQMDSWTEIQPKPEE